MCMQISAANDSAAFGSRASKFLVTNRTLSYSAQVSGTRKNLVPECMAHEQSYWYQKLGRRTWVMCHVLAWLSRVIAETSHERCVSWLQLYDGVNNRWCRHAAQSSWGTHSAFLYPTDTCWTRHPVFTTCCHQSETRTLLEEADLLRTVKQILTIFKLVYFILY